MKLRNSLYLLLVIALSASLAVPAFAQDGAATFKAKCAACHGADGGGKMGPSLKTSALSAGEIADLLTKGNDAKKPPHKKPVSGLSADDAKAVADYVKTLK